MFYLDGLKESIEVELKKSGVEARQILSNIAPILDKCSIVLNENTEFKMQWSKISVSDWRNSANIIVDWTSTQVRETILKEVA